MNQNWTQQHPLRSILGLLEVFASIGIAIAAAHLSGNIFVYVVAVFFIAARQHSLYVLNHDASHGNLFATPEWNKRVAGFFCNALFLHHPEAFSYVLWRRVHILHHAFLFTENDPNYVGRKDRGDTEEPLSIPKLLRNLASAPLEAIRNFFLGNQDYVPPGPQRSWDKKRRRHQALLWLPIPNDREMELERRWKLVIFVSLAILVYLTGTATFVLLYWVVPMYTVYPAILRWMDLTEHNWEVKNGRLASQTNSRLDSIVSRLFLSDSYRHLHWEHHVNPRVPYFRLKPYSHFLREAEKEKPRLLRGFLELR